MTEARTPSTRPHGQVVPAGRAIPLPLLVLAVSALWGSNFVAVKAALEHSSPLLLACLRTAVAGVAMGGVAWALGARVPTDRRRLGAIAWIALHMTTLSTGFLVAGVDLIPAGVASILINTMPLFMVLLARPMLGERPTQRSLAGLAAGFAGVVVIAVPAARGGGHPLGMAFILLAALTWASGSILYKRADLADVHPAMIISVQLLLSSLGLGAANILVEGLEGPQLELGFFVALGWTSLGGLALAFLAWGEVLKRASALAASAGRWVA